MTKETVRVTFYNNTKCGYYNSDKQVEFGGLAEIFQQIHQWSQGQELSLTKISNPAPESELLPTYLMDIQRHDDDWVFALWIQTPDHEGKVASISMNCVVGQPIVHENPLEPMTLAGFPAYFWCSPGQGLFATVAFPGVKAGRPEMEKYFADFLATMSSYVVVTADEQGVETISGYRKSPEEEALAVTPSFANRPIKNPGEVEYILQHQAEIRKVVRKAHVRTDKVADKNFFVSVVRFLGGRPVDDVQFSTKSIKVELEYKPSEDELQAMIDHELALPHAMWDDMGFVMKGESQPHWLSRSRASATFEFDINRVDGVPTVASVATAFKKDRNALLNLVKT